MASDLLEEARREMDDRRDEVDLVTGILVGTGLGIVVWLTLICLFGG